METLEEVAERYANDWEEIHPILDSEDMTPIAVSKIDFIAGAKWQAERMYSEEIINILDNVRYWETCPDDYKVIIESFLEQYKK